MLSLRVMLDNTLNQKFNTIKDICSENPDLKTEAAYKLNLTENNYEKLLDFLSSNSSDLMYYALLKIDRFKTKEDALILLHLINPDQDSRIRELSSDLIKGHCHYFDNDDSIRLLVEAIKDKNPKVCRNITYALQNINNRFMIIEKLVNIIEEQINDIKMEQTKDRSVFIIYWSLFAIENLLNTDNMTINTFNKLIETLRKTSRFKEYQLRERSAAIVRLLTQQSKQEKLVHLTKQLLNDENFYVRVAISKME